MLSGAVHVDVTGAGPPLVLLHGWALHAGLFAPIVPSLSSHFHVHAVDLPGHGLSAPMRPWSVANVVDALERRFAATSDLSVLGWSLGGAIALRWAHRFPARIARLLLVSATPKFVAANDWDCAMTETTLSRFADELRVFFKPTLLRFLTLQVQGSDEGRRTLASLRQQWFARGAPDRSTLEESLGELRALDLRDEVRSVHQPTLVVTGTRDTLTPPEAGAWLARALPAGRVESLVGAAHAPFISHPGAFLASALAFLDHA